MKADRHKAHYRIYMQYILIGAALGLYYGLFYKEPTTPPDYVMALILSLGAALVTVIVRSWRMKKPLKESAVDFLKIFALFAFFLVGLELRKTIYALWGKNIVAVFTTSFGVLIGLVLAISKKDTESDNTQKRKD